MMVNDIYIYIYAQILKVGTWRAPVEPGWVFIEFPAFKHHRHPDVVHRWGPVRPPHAVLQCCAVPGQGLGQGGEAGHCINDLFYSAGDMAVSEKISYRKKP